MATRTVIKPNMNSRSTERIQPIMSSHLEYSGNKKYEYVAKYGRFNIEIYFRRAEKSAADIRQVSTCQAVKSAVSVLYNIDDFELSKIGEGFFCEVFKVRKKWLLLI